MQTIHRSVALVAAVLSMSLGCSHNNERSTMAQNEPPPARTEERTSFKAIEAEQSVTPAQLPGAKVIDLDDDEVADVIETLNAGEVKVAKEALPLVGSGDARTYANRMISAHTDANKTLKTFVDQKDIGTDGNAVSDALEKHVDDTIDHLKDNRTGADNAYLQSQVTMHRAALALLDCVLEPTTQNIDLLNFIQSSVRPAVASHLDIVAEKTKTSGIRASDRSDCPAVCGTTSALPADLRDTVCKKD